jgi:hypothetical protein
MRHSRVVLLRARDGALTTARAIAWALALIKDALTIPEEPVRDAIHVKAASLTRWQTVRVAAFIAAYAALLTVAASFSGGHP